MMMSLTLSSISFLLIMLAMMVSESKLGLSLLVSISHLHNSSNSYYINMLTFDKLMVPPFSFLFFMFVMNHLILYTSNNVKEKVKTSK